MLNEELQVGFVGNPNCGKTTLFNAYTGAKLKVANWPGVTVEKKEGAMKYHSHTYHLVDLPGIYSLTSYTMEEKLTREYIMQDDVDVIVNVVDASSLERNLYLTLCLIELGKPVILALNMMDIVKERGMELDLHRMPEILGIPIVPVSARKRTGLEVLMHAVAHHTVEGNEKQIFDYPEEIEQKIEQIRTALKKEHPDMINSRWYAIKLLEQDPEITQKYGHLTADFVDRSYEKDIINAKYHFIEKVLEEVLVNKEKKAESTDNIDQIFTHPILGIPVFLGIMAIVFFLTFTVGDFLKGYVETFINMFSTWLGQGLEGLGVSKFLISLVTDGVITGVGGVISFLPNIIVLFFAMGILEDSGYMSRVAFVMDGIMDRLGLSGRAFIPMLLGFGCSVPAVMASRALEDERDRKRTIMMIPFMSCSAKLPIYLIFSKLFFGKMAMVVAYSMYVIGVVLGIFVLFVHGKLSKKQEKQSLLIELPEYKTPNARTITIYVWSKVKDFLSKAGTTIFVASIIMWVLLNFNHTGMVTDMSKSFGASFGKVLVPILAPAGLGMWQIAVMLISGLAAKEVVASSFLVLFNASAVGSEQVIHLLGNMGFGPVNAFCLLIFCLLYTPCLGTVLTIRNEVKSTKWTLGLVAFQMIFAWIMAVIIFQIFG